MKGPVVDLEKCIGCGACFKVCATDPRVMQIREVDGEYKSIIENPEVCDYGKACVRVCPTGAFQVFDE